MKAPHLMHQAGNCRDEETTSEKSGFYFYFFFILRVFSQCTCGHHVLCSVKSFSYINVYIYMCVCACTGLNYEQLLATRPAQAMQAARSVMNGGARRVRPVHFMAVVLKLSCLNFLLIFKITRKKIKNKIMHNLEPTFRNVSKAIWTWMSTQSVFMMEQSSRLLVVFSSAYGCVKKWFTVIQPIANLPRMASFNQQVWQEWCHLSGHLINEMI